MRLYRPPTLAQKNKRLRKRARRQEARWRDLKAVEPAHRAGDFLNFMAFLRNKILLEGMGY